GRPGTPRRPASLSRRGGPGSLRPMAKRRDFAATHDTWEVLMATRYALTVTGLVLAAGLLAGAQSGEAVRPEKVIHLFDGKDFTGLYAWVKGSGREDPAKVFTVRDGMIDVSVAKNGSVA